jgi:non-ribosomal peptide synthetase component F
MIAAWEILGAIMNGATLHIRGSGDTAWADCLRRVDTVIATPSVVLKHLAKQEDFPNVKTIAVAGEPCPKGLADHWAPHVKFWNMCGPTEITIVNSGHLHTPGSNLSIGKPNPNNTIYILDDNENPVKIGESGVMWAGGRCVSRGYLNQPGLTESRYKPDKFTSDGLVL